MINITREPISPVSLQREEIQNYILEMAEYLEDSTNKVKPKPPTGYRDSDLLQAFDRNFFSKCYLTEKWFASSWAMDVEHFEGKNDKPELRFEWTNLFPADHIANMIKPRNTPDGGYLNPCNETDDVEKGILYSLSTMGEAPKFEPLDPNNVKAQNTCDLLDRVHNGHDENTKNSTKDLRHAIQKKYNEVLLKIIDWQRHPENSPLKHQAARELKEMLSKKASYTMLIRSMPSVQYCIPKDFLD